MSMLQMLTGGSTTPPTTYVEDVFSAYTYTGNGSTQTITNGIDLAGKGGMVWLKQRDVANAARLNDGVVNGVIYDLIPSDTGSYAAAANNVTGFTASGYSLGNGGNVNASTKSYVSWTFRKADKFFIQAQVTVSGSNQTVDLSSLGTVGMVTVKRTDSTSNWYTFHRSLTTGKLVYLNTTAAETTDGSITLSGTTLTLVQATIGNGTYIVYAWAHDTSAGGLIQCGGYTTDSNGFATVNLGWEPQFYINKCTTTGGGNGWLIQDSARGFCVTSTSKILTAHSAAAESSGNQGEPTPTGIYANGGSLATYMYMAIRRGPMKTPTSGTQVYNAIARTGTGAADTVTGVGFPPDLVLIKSRNNGSMPTVDYDRLRGGRNKIIPSATTAEADASTGLLSFTMGGATFGIDTGDGTCNYLDDTYINWFFRRNPGVFDEVCYTGTGAARSVAHNLAAVPELMIVKSRSSVTDWAVYHSVFGGSTLYLRTNSAGGPAGNGAVWNSTIPSSSTFTVGTDGSVNTSTGTYVAYLFATLAGVSKVGSYTGNGSSQTINCGFAAGARFILIKRTDSTGDWFTWDSTRGIVAGNDPYLSLNTTSAEVTTDDSVDTDATGFIVNQLAATNINVTSATYIFLSFA